MQKVQYPRPSTWELLCIWTIIGLQSFGGSTTLLIQREFIHKRHWLTMEDFSLCWNQCVFTPGINLVALTILIGCKLGGISGMFASLIGMMVPSSLITLFLTIGFSFIARLSATQTVLKGVIPATAGFLLVVGFSFAQPTLKSAYKKNIWHFSASIAIVIASIIAINVFQIAIMIVLPAAAIIGMLIFTPWKISKKPTPLPEAEKETVEN